MPMSGPRVIDYTLKYELHLLVSLTSGTSTGLHIIVQRANTQSGYRLLLFLLFLRLLHSSNETKIEFISLNETLIIKDIQAYFSAL